MLRQFRQVGLRRCSEQKFCSYAPVRDHREVGKKYVSVRWGFAGSADARAEVLLLLSLMGYGSVKVSAPFPYITFQITPPERASIVSRGQLSP